mmetsp:Transcript_21042/g.41276  ORF Transcript_21042/g.41276 Transcript_21042/m.41276 type:complete len:97 (-) Transcript_21042:265-555(-)
MQIASLYSGISIDNQSFCTVLISGQFSMAYTLQDVNPTFHFHELNRKVLAIALMFLHFCPYPFQQKQESSNPEQKTSFLETPEAIFFFSSSTFHKI